MGEETTIISVMNGLESEEIIGDRYGSEKVLLAVAVGIDLSEKDILEWLAILPTLSPDGKTSMLQDIEADRPTEVAMFAGKVVAMGRELGVATPVNAAMLHIIRVLE